MARGLPCYVRELFGLLQTCGVTQQSVATRLGLIKQAVNNWATGYKQLPQRYRGPFFQIVRDAMEDALRRAARQSPDALATVRTQCHSALLRWHFELQETRGVSDAWHQDLGRRLALAFKSPLSEQGVAAWQAELELHLEAANLLRRLLRLHNPASPPHQLESAVGALEDPLGWFAAMVKVLDAEAAPDGP